MHFFTRNLGEIMKHVEELVVFIFGLKLPQLDFLEKFGVFLFNFPSLGENANFGWKRFEIRITSSKHRKMKGIPCQLLALFII